MNRSFPVFVFICMRRTLLLLLLLLQWRTVYSASTCGLSPSTVVVNQSEFDAKTQARRAPTAPKFAPCGHLPLPLRVWVKLLRSGLMVGFGLRGGVTTVLRSRGHRYDTIRYDTRCYFNVRSKADISQLNLPHGTDN